MDNYTLEEILVNSNQCINYGYISELAILKEFIKNGFEVHIPFGNSLILYQTFINYKSYGLRGFLNRMRRIINCKSGT